MHLFRRAVYFALVASAVAVATTVYAADSNIQYASDNLINSAASTPAPGTPPSGYRNWTSASGVIANYTNDSSCNCLKIEVENTTTSPQHFAMVSNTELQPATGDYLRLQGNIEVENADARSGTIVGVGFENYGGTKSQLADGPLSVVEPSRPGIQQIPVTYYAAGTAAPRYDEVLPYLQARLKVYNIAAGAKIKLKVRSLAVNRAQLTGTWVRPLSTTDQIVRQDKPFKLTAELIAPATVKNHRSAIRFLWAGLIATDYGPRATTTGLSDTLGTGAVRDTWNFTAAPHTPAYYDVYYRLIPPASNAGAVLKPTDPAVVEATAPSGIGGGKYYKIGRIQVVAAGMDIGNAFHKIQPDNVPVAYDFARSLSHEKTALKNWWRFDTSKNEPVMAWEEPTPNDNFSNWVTAVSGSGRKALITFYGMRAEIAAYPNAVSPAWGNSVDPGFISPPSQLGMATYGKVVRKTVAKFQNSIYAVECWNEPDSAGHFFGSTTQLADLCQTVYNETKAVDTTNQIKILCPQAVSPAGIGWILSARTSDNHAITDYCDTVGAHLYGYTGDSASGKPYSQSSLSNAIKDMKNRIAQYPGAATKALAVTEFGTHQCLWNGGYTAYYSSADISSNNSLKGSIVYDSLLALKEQNVRIVALYSYDNRGENPSGGCYIDNYSWQYIPGPDTATPGTPNTPVIDKINAAVNNF